MTVFLSVLGCLVAGIIGAKLSLMSSNGGSAWLAFIGGQVSLVVWAWMTKQPLSPWVAAILFDATYNLSWLATLMALGERPSLQQGLGAVVTISGLMLVLSDKG